MSVVQWVADRVPSSVVHLDAAACGRVSEAVLAEVAGHARLEAERGGYVAEVLVDDRIAQGRAALGALVGLAGQDVVLGESGGSQFATLLDAWPLERGARVGTVAGEYGGNARVLRDRASRRGWQLVLLETDELGRVTAVPPGLDLLTLPQVASQRGVVQPVGDLLATGTPVMLDVAQSAGQTAVPAGAAAYVGTSRKWLCGPRGVGWAAVDPAWHARLADPPTLGPTAFDDLRRLDTTETHVAGRVGLALAVRTWTPALLPVLQAAAQAARVLLDGAGGWRVLEPLTEPTGITTLRHDDADPVAVRAALLADDLLVSAVPITRADDLDAPLLRVSTAAWTTPGDLERLAAALHTITG